MIPLLQPSFQTLRLSFRSRIKPWLSQKERWQVIPPWPLTSSITNLPGYYRQKWSYQPHFHNLQSSSSDLHRDYERAQWPKSLTELHWALWASLTSYRKVASYWQGCSYRLHQSWRWLWLHSVHFSPYASKWWHFASLGSYCRSEFHLLHI